MRVVLMEGLIHNVKPKHIQECRPGRVGSVGDVFVKPRLRTSTPEMPWRSDPYWAKRNKQGSNVQDGDTLGYDNDGGSARCFDSKWFGNRDFKHQYGFTFHDIQSPDKRTEPWISSLGDFSWRRKLATVRIAKRTGQLFSIKPGGYAPEQNDLLRGGAYPVTESFGGTEGPLPTEKTTPSPVVAAGYGGNDVRAGVSNLGIQETTDAQRRRLSNLRL